MGFLGLSLLFVGITLVSNGLNRFLKIDGKSTAFMNLFTGSILFIGNIIMLAKAGDIMQYQNVASGFLFGITYLFIAANYLFKLDLRPFGLYSLFVAIYAIIMAISSYTVDIRFTLLWGAWAALWLEGFLELVLKIKLEKIFPYLSIFIGLFAAFIPAILMLTDKW
ncbi:MAG: hypothetical protein FWC97_01860 [Treponema sp.]|nr:hypothetical protein [Treponema sp.]